MVKLVLKYHCSDGCTFGVTTHIPFEYSSKEDFILMVLDKIDEHKKYCIEQYGEKDGSEWYKNGTISLWELDFSVNELESSIENSVFELNEWFEKEKMYEKIPNTFSR